MEMVENSKWYDPHAQPYPIPCYKGYEDNVWKWSAIESIHSLIRSKGGDPSKRHVVLKEVK